MPRSKMNPVLAEWPASALLFQRSFKKNYATNRPPIAQHQQRLCVIMGGGEGKRLFPLTKDRAKPAVPLAGKYRLVDIPISNCINSGFRRVYILTQFNSASLHSHISRTYKFDQFTTGFVEILAAQQTPTNTSWYEGTADAVRKNLIHFLSHDFDYLVILSGDQLYRMDFRPLIAQHKETGADITVATIPVNRAAAQSLGILQIADDLRITRFVEKPKDAAVLESLKLTPEMQAQLEIKDGGESFLASMGIYVFNRKLICELLDNSLSDFGKHIIPQSIPDPPRLLLCLSGLLGRCRDHPLLFRGESRPRHRTAALQLLRHERAGLQPSALPARLQDQQRAD
jgi:glucose-1-phosphate adenylyltransferase